MYKESKKGQFLDNLKAAGGIITVACENTGVNRSTYYRWREEDAEFRAQADEIIEMQVDFVESKLLELINHGDTTATIFYLKTKGKKRGYNEKAITVEVRPPEQPPTIDITTKPEALPGKVEEVKDIKSEILKKVKNKKAYIVKLLKQQGKYTPELSMQAGIAAQLLVKTEMLADEIFSDSHSAVNVEYSREGDKRESISPREKLYIDYMQQSQKALRALGMNTDSHERKADGDAFNEFIEKFREDEE